MTDDQGNLFTTLYDPPLARAEGLRGQALAESHLDGWRSSANAFVGDHVGHTITADDLTRAVGLPTREDGSRTNNGIGGYMGGLARRGILKLQGFENSHRVTNHARVMRVWLVMGKP